MNVVDGLKTLYVANGGSESDLTDLNDNDIQNMHSVLYGDGLDVKLSKNVEDNILEMAKHGGGGGGSNLLIVRFIKLDNGDSDTQSNPPDEFLSVTYNDIVNTGYCILDSSLEVDPDYHIYYAVAEHSGGSEGCLVNFHSVGEDSYYPSYSFVSNSPDEPLKLLL